MLSRVRPDLSFYSPGEETEFCCNKKLSFLQVVEKGLP